MSMLDFHSPKLLSLFQAKKGAVGERHRAQIGVELGILLQVSEKVC